MFINRNDTKHDVYVSQHPLPFAEYEQNTVMLVRAPGWAAHIMQCDIPYNTLYGFLYRVKRQEVCVCEGACSVLILPPIRDATDGIVCRECKNKKSLFVLCDWVCSVRMPGKLIAVGRNV